MKNWEVAIIVVAVVIVGWMWYQAHSTTTPANPVNAASPGLKTSGMPTA